MRTLPQSFPLSAYIGRTVATVVEAPHQVELGLAGGQSKSWVNFEGPAIVHFPDGTEHRVENAMLIAGNGMFQALCGSTVERVKRLSESSCKFGFSNGYALTLLGDEAGYESYHLGIEGDFCNV